MSLRTWIGKVFGRASLENPSTTLSDPDVWLYDAFSGGSKSDSGVRVGYKQALMYAAVWRGVNLISRDVAKIPLNVYVRLPDGGKERATAHPAYKLLRRQPSPYIKAFDLKQTLQAHVLLCGNGYAYVYRDGAGTPIELLPLNPMATYPKRDPDGRVWYVTRLTTGEERKLAAENVLHVRGLGFDGLQGYDVVTYARNTLGLGLAMQKFGAKFFNNGAAMNVVIKRPADAPPWSEETKANFRSSWAKMHEGLENSHRTALLEDGMEAVVLAIDAKRAQLAEMRAFELREIANVLGVPPHKLGDTTRTAYASLEQENQAYLDEALDGWLCQWEEECGAKLLTEKERNADTHFVEFQRDALVRVDLRTQVDVLVTEVNNGLLSLDEARAIRNRPALPNGLGAGYRIPANILQLGADEPKGL